MNNKIREATAARSSLRAMMTGAGLIALTFALGLPGAHARAASLGTLTVNSGLGQPLDAEIELTATREELDSLGARLASPAAYRQAALQFSRELAPLTFTLVQRRDRGHAIRIASTRAVNEPVVDLLVELAWRGGTRSYGYTALLDPSGMSPRAAVAPAIQTPPAAEPRGVATVRRVAVVDKAEKRVAEQLRAKAEQAAIGRQRLADAKERIAELELTVRRQQQRLDMEKAAAMANEPSQRPADAKAHATAAPRSAAPAAPAAATRWTDALQEPAYLGGAAVLLLAGLMMVKRRRSSDEHHPSDPHLRLAT